MKSLVALVMMFCAPGVFAADRLGTPLEDKFRLTAGFFSATTETRVRADANDGSVGTTVSAERDLGLRERTEMADVEVQMRLRPRHSIRLNYFQLDRRGQKALARQIEFGNQTYLVNDLTESRLSVSNFSTTYSYMFLRRERFELGASLGLQLYTFEGNVSVPARLVEEEESETGPVPIVGVEGTVRFSSRWHAEARMEYLGVRVNDVKAHLKNLKGAVYYRFNNNMAVGLGYAVFDMLVRVEDAGDAGRWEFNNRGGELLFRVSF